MKIELPEKLSQIPYQGGVAKIGDRFKARKPQKYGNGIMTIKGISKHLKEGWDQVCYKWDNLDGVSVCSIKDFPEWFPTRIENNG